MNYLDKFLSNTKPAGECLEWTRCFNSDGYPRAAYKGSSNGKVHRIVYQLTNPDEDIDGKVIRHTCDNPKCINPNHLESGTPADNMRDRDTRGRHALAAFNAKQIIAIRTMYATGLYTHAEIGNLFNVNYRTIQQVVTNKTYRWV